MGIKSLLKKIWNDPVGSKVLASGIIALVLGAGTKAFGLWAQVVFLCNWIVLILLSDVTLPTWLFLVALLLLYIASWLGRNLHRDTEPAFVNYTNDHLFEVDWHWTWIKPNIYCSKYQIDGLYARCPKCGSRLEENFDAGPPIICINEACNWQWNFSSSKDKYIGSMETLEKKVSTEIERKLYSGEFMT